MLLLTYPLARWHILWGKLLGHALVMSLACLLGFGITAALLLGLGDAQHQRALIVGICHLIASGILLALVFVLIGYWVSLAVREKAKALGVLLLLWFALVLVYDLVLLTTLVGFADSLSRELVNLVILLNPTDLFRALNLLANPSEHLAAKSSLALVTQLGLSLPVMYGLLVAWIGALLLGATWFFKRMDI